MWVVVGGACGSTSTVRVVGGIGGHGGGELQCRQRLHQLHPAARLVWEPVLILRIVRKVLGQRRGYLLR